MGDINEASRRIRDGADLNNDLFIENLNIDGKWWDKFKKRIFLCGKIVGKRILKKKNQEYNAGLREYFEACEGSTRKKDLALKLKNIVTSISKENLFKAQISDRIHFEKCSAPFFSSIKQRKKMLYIGKFIDKNGRILTKREEIENYLVGCYEELYKDRKSDKKNYNYFFQDLPVIGDDILGREEENKINESEVKDAINRAKNGKCPGIDGIPVEFYKKYKELLVPYMTKLFNNCMITGEFPWSWRKSLIKLIPKNEDLDFSFNNIRPLTMGNTDKKIYATVWYQRLVKISVKIINKWQTGGIPGRSIQGSTLLIHLLINYYYEKGLEGYLLNLDDTKAYDILIRCFIWDTMKEFGFSDYTIKNIKGLYKDSMGMLCVNGFISKTFDIKSGVLQGCPLSGLLYIISGEPLARAIHKDIIIKGFRLPSQQEIKMVQHVDDKTLLVNDQKSILNSLEVIRKFSEMSGSVINYSKSFIIKLGHCRNDLQEQRVDFQGIKIISEEDNHGCRAFLGILFSSVPVTYVDKNFYEVTKKCQKILDIWDDRNLSLIGRILVVNTLVISKLVYILQTVNITKKRLEFLEKRISKFIWKGMGSKLKLGILEWGRERGGLGLIPVDLKARSLRLKTIKGYLGKSEEGRDKGPVTQILAYFLDMVVRNECYGTLENLKQVFQDPITGHGGVLAKINNKEHELKYYLDDIREFKSFDRDNNNIEIWSSVDYLHKLIDKRTENEISILRAGRNSDKIYFLKQYFTISQEKEICKNSFYKGLDTKIQAFNYKMNNNLLPIFGIIGGNNKFCRYCKNKIGFEITETMEHVFMECLIPTVVWRKINRILHSKGLAGIEIDRETIIYKLGIKHERIILVSEVNWALWRNRNSNSFEENNTEGALVVRKMYVNRLEKLVRIDKAVLSAVKFRERWEMVGGISEILRNE